MKLLKLSKLFSLKCDKDSTELALAWFYKDVRFLVIYGDARDQTVIQKKKEEILWNQWITELLKRVESN